MPVDLNTHPVEDLAGHEHGSEGVAARASSSPFVPFRQPIFRAVWLATLVSNFGGLIQAVAASWFMTTIAASPDLVALVQASTTLPVMMFSLAAGALSDNYDRRLIMLVAQGFLFTVSAMLAVLGWFGLLSPWLLLTFTFLIGCGTALNNPAWQASVGDMVPRPDIPAATMLNSAGFNLARSVGPAIGGLIVASAGAAIAFVINAASYLALIVVLARWRPVRPKRLLPRETMGIAMSAGLRYVAMSPNILSVMLRGCAFGFGGIVALALLPLIARDLVKGGPLTYGILLGGFGVGAVVGAFVSARLRAMLTSEALVRSTFLVFAIGMAVAGISRWMWLSVPAVAAAGACWVLALSTFNATVQLSAPRWVVGRALALYQMATFGGMAGGSWLWGWLMLHVGIEQALFAASAALVAGAALGLRSPLPPLATLNLDPLSRWREPQIAVDIEPRSGPIIVTIEYLIHDADVFAFLDAMSERRRIRRRDGARQWTLLRDLANPELWIERYESPTWLEYVRHNQRVTQADAEVSDRLRALHHGTSPPVAHRLIERQVSSSPRPRLPK
ncbi:MAG: MFS transporter [Alphaproteobacteria bacterium]|nr:MFS transporter [Alphaproteobacteria bacterium]